MGTNYYWHHNECDCCGRYDEWHVGKSSGILQAITKWHDEEPWLRLVVGTWRQWKLHLRSGGSLWDEYGKQLDVEEFIAQVDAWGQEHRRRQWEWMRDHGRRTSTLPNPEVDYLDPDGYSFSTSDFS